MNDAQYVRFQVDGGTVAGRCFGTGDTGLFLHGILVNGHVWDPLVALLRSHMRLVLLDLPLGGHHTALHPDADCSLGAHAERVIAIAKQLPGPVVLIGNDTGGALAQLAVTRAPELFRRLILLPSDAFEHCPPQYLSAIRVLPHIPGSVAFLAWLLRSEFAMRLFMMVVSQTRLDRVTLDLILGDLRTSAAVRNDLTKLLSNLRPEVTRAVAKELHRFARPVMVVWSKRDPIFPLEDGQKLASLFPNARLETIAGTRAFVSLDQPERLAQLVLGFFAES